MGSAIKNDEILVLDFATYELVEIFLNAEIIALLSLVNSTDHKSAIYSLLREIANLTNGYNKYHSNKKANPKKNIHQLFFEEEDDEDVLLLIIICHTIDTAHTKTYATYINKESLFIRCVSSCHATASISFLFKFCNNPLVKATHESSCFRHVAKAFIPCSSIIAILGIGSHFVIHKFSTILYISGFSFLVTSLAPDNPNIISFCNKNDMIHQTHNTIKTIGNIFNVVSSHALKDISAFEASVKNKEIMTQNIINKSAGYKINSKTVFLWFYALKF